MRVKLFTLMMLFTLACSFSYGQYIRYRYDASGNRVERKLIDMTYKSSGVEEEEEEEYEDVLADVSFSIFPNPTTGLLKVRVSNIPEGEQIKIELYNINGILIEKRNYSNSEEILDLSSRLQGVYLLVITMKEQSSTWKILKR